MKQPLVTIGMPVWNGQEFLRQALDSLLAQDYSNIELIILDNISTDDTPHICREYARKDPRVRYIRDSEKVFVTEGHRRVAAFARGEFFMVACDDDVYDPTYISRLISPMHANPAVGLVYSGWGYISPDGTRTSVNQKGIHFLNNENSRFRNFMYYLFARKPIPISFGLIRMELHRKALPYFVRVDRHLRWDHDNLYMLRLLSLTQVDSLRDVLFYYRQRDRDALYGARKQLAVAPRGFRRYLWDVGHETKVMQTVFRIIYDAPLSRMEKNLLRAYGLFMLCFNCTWRLFKNALKNAIPFEPAVAARHIFRGGSAGAGIILLGCALGSIVQIISLRVSTELLSPAQLGSVSQLFSVAFIFVVMLIAPVSQYVSRGFLEWRDAGKLVGNLRRYLVYIVIIAAIAACAAGGLQLQFRLVNGFSVSWVMLLIAIYMLASPISTVGITGFNLQNRRGKFVFFSILSAVLSLIFATVLFKLYAAPEFWSLGQFIGLSVACISLAMLIRSLSAKSFRAVPDTTRMLPFSARAVFAFGWPVIVTSALWWIQSQSYRFILDRVQGPAYVGFFGVGYGLAATPLALYEAAYGQFFEPIYYGELKGQDIQGQAKAWNNYASAYLPGIISVGVFVASSGSFLAQVLVGESFRIAASNVVVWAAIIESMRVVGGMIYQVGIAKADMRMMILPVAVGAILAPVGVFILSRLNPLTGTALALLGAGIGALSVGIIMSRRWLPITWPFRRMLLGTVLSVPLIAWFGLAGWLLPQSNMLAALVVLSGGGLYLAGIQALFFNLRTREQS